jgi:hypothetical protein
MIQWAMQMSQIVWVNGKGHAEHYIFHTREVAVGPQQEGDDSSTPSLDSAGL